MSRVMQYFAVYRYFWTDSSQCNQDMICVCVFVLTCLIPNDTLWLIHLFYAILWCRPMCILLYCVKTVNIVLCVRIHNESTNERTNEWMNEWMNEWIVEVFWCWYWFLICPAVMRSVSWLHLNSTGFYSFFRFFVWFPRVLHWLSIT